MLQHSGIYNKNKWSRKEGSIKSLFLGLSLGANLIILCLFVFYWVAYPVAPRIISNNDVIVSMERRVVWHGGHPEEERAGSCWCGAADQYCMCTPNLAMDLILVSSDKEFLWLVRRQDTNQLATMGGFVNVDETVEHAVTRELKEEMDIDLMKKEGNNNSPVVTLFGVYSDPRRDNRRRTASVVFVVTLEEDVHPKAGDDAKEVKRISIHDIEKHSYFADHRTILLDYRRLVQGQPPKQSTLGDFAPDIARSTCA
jgi:ADP-ribose pyrophosphatase YjhB (NUDIX family)